MAKHKLQKGLALGGIISTAILWMGYGIVSLILDPGNIFGLLLGGAVGSVFLLTGLAANNMNGVGGWLLIFEGLVPVFVAISTGRMELLYTLVVAAPPIICGLLFVVD